MFSHTMQLKRLAIILLSGLFLTACEPSFETLTEQCSSTLPATLASELSEDDSEFKVEAQRATNDYKLYLEDTLNSLAGAKKQDSSPLTADEQTAVQFIFDKAKEKMGYVLENDIVTSANNPLDYVESLIAAADPDEVIQIFVDIKEKVAEVIRDQNSACSYSNSAIKLIVEDSSNDKRIVKTADVQLNINYNPFDQADNRNVDQTLLITFDEIIEENSTEDDDNIIERLNRSFFSGISRVAEEDFEAVGVSPPEVRQFNLNDEQTNETYFFDDDFDALKLGQIVTNHFNQACTLRDENGDEITDSNGLTTQADCPEGTMTRAPQHKACQGDAALQEWLAGKCPLNPEDSRQRHPACPSDESLSAAEATGSDETNQIKLNSFPVVPGHSSLNDIQRLRLEVEYPLNEIRLYASEFAERILRADATIDNYDEDDVIVNPTRCEKQAVLDDLVYNERDNPDFEGVRLTSIEDPNYDIKYKTDEDGNDVLEDGNRVIDVEPTPIFTFQGTAIPSRQ